MGRDRNEKGFALVAALMANLILLAVGFIAINLSTQDIRISMRAVGDKKAVNAAETAVHMLAMDFISDSPASIALLQGKIYNSFLERRGHEGHRGHHREKPEKRYGSRPARLPVRGQCDVVPGGFRGHGHRGEHGA